jgi:hypothetical protein
MKMMRRTDLVGFVICRIDSQQTNTFRSEAFVVFRVVLLVLFFIDTDQVSLASLVHDYQCNNVDRCYLYIVTIHLPIITFPLSHLLNTSSLYDRIIVAVRHNHTVCVSKTRV